MAAPSQSHSIIDEPTTVADCQSDYRPPAQAVQAAADARTQLGTISGQQHTHRS